MSDINGIRVLVAISQTRCYIPRLQIPSASSQLCLGSHVHEPEVEEGEWLPLSNYHH